MSKFDEVWNRLIKKYNLTAEDFHIWIEEENKKREEEMKTKVNDKRKR